MKKYVGLLLKAFAAYSSYIVSSGVSVGCETYLKVYIYAVVAPLATIRVIMIPFVCFSSFGVKSFDKDKCAETLIKKEKQDNIYLLLSCALSATIIYFLISSGEAAMSIVVVIALMINIALRSVIKGVYTQVEERYNEFKNEEEKYDSLIDAHEALFKNAYNYKNNK